MNTVEHATKIDPERIEEVIESEHYFVASDALQLDQAQHVHKREGWKLGRTQYLTLCILQLRNGFVVVGESACAHPSNFDAEAGRRYAREDAVRKIWLLEGYLLREWISRSTVVPGESLVES